MRPVRLLVASCRSREFFPAEDRPQGRIFRAKAPQANVPNPGTIEQRELLEKQLREQVDKVSRHAFETTKIAQSFAAGWYNRHAKTRAPSEDEISGFLAIAFGKLREDLRREKTE